MTPEQKKWRHIVEAAGDKWHENQTTRDHYCHCGAPSWRETVAPNPPITLDKLFEYAEKLGFVRVIIDKVKDGYLANIGNGSFDISGYAVEFGETRQLALLNALAEATGYKEE